MLLNIHLRSFQQFSDEVSDARRAGDIDKAYELIAVNMKLFGNSAYGKTVTNKEKTVSTSYGNEDNISKNINSPHFKDLEQLYGQKYEVISTKREIRMDLPLQIGVAVYHLAKLRMSDFIIILLINILIDQTLNYLRWKLIAFILHSQKITLKSLSNQK